jgi:hypothetical protein
MTDDIVHPDIARCLAERQELIRRCAVSAVEHHRAGLMSDPDNLLWARGVVARIKPLAGPLGAGEPARNLTEQACPPLSP